MKPRGTIAFIAICAIFANLFSISSIARPARNRDGTYSNLLIRDFYIPKAPPPPTVYSTNTPPALPAPNFSNHNPHAGNELEDAGYSRTGAAQIRFQAKEVNIQTPTPPQNINCEVENPDSATISQCCDPNACYQYAYCPVPESCCENNCGADGCQTCCPCGKNSDGSCKTNCDPDEENEDEIEKPAHTCINLLSFVAGESRRMLGKKDFDLDGAYIANPDAAFTEDNPIIFFRRQKNGTRKGQWDAIAIYQDEEKNYLFDSKKGVVKDFIPKNKRAAATSATNSQAIFDKYVGGCMFTVGEPEENEDPEGQPVDTNIPAKTIGNGDAGDSNPVDNLEQPPTQNIVIDPAQWENYGKTKQDLWIGGVFIPAGSVIIGVAKPRFDQDGNVINKDFFSPNEFKEFEFFEFYDPETGSLITALDKKEVKNNTRLTPCGEPETVNDKKFDEGNEFFEFQYTGEGHKGGQQDFWTVAGGMPVDNTGDNKLEISASTLAFNTFTRNVARLFSNGKDSPFRAGTRINSRELVAEWFPGIDLQMVEEAKASGDVAKLRFALGLPAENSDAEQKKLEDEMILKALEYAMKYDARNTIIEEKVDQFINNKKSGDKAIFTDDGKYEHWSEASDEERRKVVQAKRQQYVDKLNEIVASGDCGSETATQFFGEDSGISADCSELKGFGSDDLVDLKADVQESHESLIDHIKNKGSDTELDCNK